MSLTFIVDNLRAHVFVNRRDELDALARWADGDGSGLALVWGRRRVGKTALVQAFAADRETVFHTGASRPVREELRLLSAAAGSAMVAGLRDLGARPFTDWQDA